MSCAIEWRPEYVKSRFRAVTTDGLGHRVLAESDLLNWPATRPPDPTDPILEAHARLVHQLEALGWEYDEPGDPWFAQRFKLATERAA